MIDKVEIAELLLEAGAVTLSPEKPYIFASGIKSPIYTDNRILMSFPSSRKKVVKAYIDAIKNNGFEPDVIAGVAVAGIPWAAWVAHDLNKPMIFVRKAEKDHGKQNLIEGKFKVGDKVVLIEDHISSGGSTIAAAKSLKDAHLHLEGCVAISTYSMRTADTAVEEAKLKLQTLTDFESLIDVAVKSNKIKKSEQDLVLSWARNPQGWKP